MSGRLFRDAAFADERSPDPRLGVSVLVDSNLVVWIRPSDAEEEIGPAVEIVASSGATIVPGLVHCHSHLTLPGGAHWLDHTRDSSWWVSIALTYRSRLSSPRRSFACTSAVYPTMSVNITATSRRSSTSLTAAPSTPLGRTGKAAHGEHTQSSRGHPALDADGESLCAAMNWRSTPTTPTSPCARSQPARLPPVRLRGDCRIPSPPWRAGASEPSVAHASLISRCRSRLNIHLWIDGRHVVHWAQAGRTDLDKLPRGGALAEQQ